LFGCDFLRVRPQWLRLNGKRLELDGYNESLALAFEHQGAHHYEEQRYGATGVSQSAQKERDAFKRKTCKKHGVTLVIIPEVPRLLKLEMLDAFIRKSIASRKDLVKVISKKRPVALKKAELSHLKMAERTERFLRTLRERRGTLVSQYLGAKHKVTVKCSEGHLFEIAPTHVVSGKWCKKCYLKKIRETPTELVSVGELRALAKQRKGVLVSRVVKRVEEPLIWKCNIHKVLWSASAYSIRKGSWCKICGHERAKKKIRKGLMAMKVLAESRGGRCLSKSYVNMSTKLDWECEKGHGWSATPSNIVHRKSWCPICAGREG
jgi:hypothetical protein